ncbi:MAG: hypothetical protein NZ853_08780 [Leptospiraceae bacterium]|nr:hypothetical protein [Leptospiraceae bacterium]MDW7976730.1 hypothetical protein [Leptospiraceae bacterium]
MRLKTGKAAKIWLIATEQSNFIVGVEEKERIKRLICYSDI